MSLDLASSGLEKSTFHKLFMTIICLFLKAPHPGLVKTRLARDIGFPRATAIYRALVERQIKAVPPEWPVVVYFSPSEAEPEMSVWLGHLRPAGLLFHPQCEGDLGARLAGAVESEFTRGATRIFLLGGDCPTLNASDLIDAHACLASHDLVFGPATDGGYVLFGLKAHHPSLFKKIAWSTSQVLTQTLTAAKKLGLTVKLMPPHEDIDDLASLNRQARWLP